MRFFAIVILLISIAHAKESPIDPFSGDAVRIKVLTEKNKPIDELPKGFEAPKNKVSLLSNFTPGEDGKVDVYLVNRTKTMLKLEAQDADPYLKMEYQKGTEWVRAQPHAYSWCGNSYFGGVYVLPQHFAALKAYWPREGTKAMVRYRIYQSGVEIVSPAAAGLVNADDLRKAANDVMSLAFGDFAHVKSVALGEKVLKNEMDHMTDLREVAIRCLGSFPEEQAKPVLDKIAAKDAEKYEDALKVAREEIVRRKEEKMKEK